MQNSANQPPTTLGGLTIPLEIRIQNLLDDKLLSTAPRTTLDGQSYPALNDIPLLSKLGSGAMGAVYFGIHPRLHKNVAVKVLYFELIEKQPDLIERFFREARMAAQIESGHLVQVLDVNEDNGLYFLVMEYVRGKSSGEHLRSGRGSDAGLGEATVLEIALGAAQGLAAAHEASVIHRDIKPDNILVPEKLNRASGQVIPLFAESKVADLGIARSEQVDKQLTNTEIALGSPGYMAPEQIRDSRTVGPAADVFGLGATMYALLTGEPPFGGTSAIDILMSTLQQPHHPLAELRNDLSPSTTVLIERCLEKDPAKRYPDGAALVEGLRACCQEVAEKLKDHQSLSASLLRAAAGGQSSSMLNTALPTDAAIAPTVATPGSGNAAPLRAATATALTNKEDQSGGAPFWRFAFGLAALLLLALYVANSLSTSKGNTPNQDASNQVENKEGEVAVQARFSDAMKKAQQAFKRQKWEQAEADYNSALLAAPGNLDALKGAADAAVAQAQSELANLQTDANGRYIFQNDIKRVQIENILARALGKQAKNTMAFEYWKRLENPLGEIKRVSGHEGEVRSIAAFPEDEMHTHAGAISAGADGTLRFWCFGVCQQVHRIEMPKDEDGSLKVKMMPDHLHFVTSNGRSLALWSLKDAKKIQDFLGHNDTIQDFDISSNGEQIVTVSKDGLIRRWAVKSGKQLKAFSGSKQPLQRVAFTPNGKQILSGGSDKQPLKLWDMDGTLKLSFGEKLGTILDVQIAPDNTTILCYTSFDYLFLFDLNTGKKIKQHEFKNEKVGRTVHFGFLPDAQRVIIGGRDLTMLWDLKDWKEIRRFQTLDKRLRTTSVFVSPDGHFAVTGTADGQLVGWRLPPSASKSNESASILDQAKKMILAVQ